ncbi:MAG: hypothetical protein Q9195_007699 [Heterodermia aff. obscurata]
MAIARFNLYLLSRRSRNHGRHHHARSKSPRRVGKPTTDDMTLSGSHNDFGGDPYPGHNKNFTILMGYPAYGSGGGASEYEYRIMIGYDRDNAQLTIPINPPPLPSTPAVLGPSVPHEVPTYNIVNFRNFTPLTVWPKLCMANRVVWNGRKIGGDWLMGSGKSRIFLTHGNFLFLNKGLWLPSRCTRQEMK